MQRWAGALSQAAWHPEAWLIAVAVVAGALILALAAFGRARYRCQEKLCTNAELRFLRALEEAVGGDWRIFAKVRVADVITPRGRSNRSSWWRAFRRISSKHVDYVVVDRMTTRILAAIELDDRSHRKVERRARDRFLDRAFAQAGIPLLRFRVQGARYRPDEIHAALSAVLGEGNP